MSPKKQTKKSFLDQFLGEPEKDAEPTVLPVGGDFVPGYIGQVTARLVYKVFSRIDIQDDEFTEDEELEGLEWSRWGREDSWHYYFVEQEQAARFAKFAAEYEGMRRFSGRMWRFEMATESVLNVADMDTLIERRGQTIGGDCRVHAITYKDGRHKFHMMSLPSAIQAAALSHGYIDEPVFDLMDLVEARVFDDKQTARLIGGEFGEDGQMVKVDWEDSDLYGRRAELWAALGEENPKAYNHIGAGTKYDTESDQLNRCLAIVTRDWPGPLWGRLVFVPDPSQAEQYEDRDGNTRHRAIPCLVKIFSSEDEAKAAAEAEMSDKGEAKSTEAKTAKATGDPDAPKVPKAWEGFEEGWIDALRGRKDRVEDGKKPVGKVLGQIVEELEVKVSDVLDWWDHV